MARRPDRRCWRSTMSRRVADEGYQQTENGYGILDNGSYAGVDTHRHARSHAGDVVVVVRLAWQRHPPLQVVAPARAPVRRTGRTGMTPAAGGARYIDRWSMISEYIGSTMLSAAIQFVEPTALGLSADTDDAVAVCARLGSG